MADLASGIVEDAQHLIELELELAKHEAREFAAGNAKAIGFMAAGGILAMLAILVALPLTFVLIVPWHCQAALVWLLLYAVLAAAFALYGKSRLALKPLPKTLESLKETKRWALHRMKLTAN